MSRQPRDFVVLGFASTHDALAAEALLKDLGVPAVPVPAPKELGALCGIAMRLEPSDEERALVILERGGLEPTSRTVVQDV